MKTRITMLLALMLALVCTAASAQEYYTLPEIREQAAAGWHETYTDKYGRDLQVDVDIDVFGEEMAPIIRACWGDPQTFTFPDHSPRWAIIEAREKHGGESIYPYSIRGKQVDLNYQYAEEYENDLTIGEVYSFLKELLQEQGITQEYIWEKPEEFSVLYSRHKKNGSVLVPGCYCMLLWPQEYGLPILAHVGESFKRSIDGPIPSVGVSIDMSDRNVYAGGGADFDVAEVLEEDIPLCSVSKAIEGAREMIEAGYIQQVLSLRFGYVIYSDPNDEWGKQRSSYDTDTWYLVPSWVMECYIRDNPKVDKLREYPRIWEMTINAQTGEMMDHFDKSWYGRGDGRYKGFVSWDDVQ